MSFSPYPYADAFGQAESYLSKGRSKVDRPVASNTRLRRIDADTIALVLHHTAVVTYHRDGTFTIYGGGWNTVTTKQRIRGYSPADPHSDGKGGWIVGQTGNYTPARVQKCRTCKGKGVWAEAEECSGPSWWGDSVCRGGGHDYTIPMGEPGWWESRYDAPCQHGQMERHVTEPCQHGQMERHVTGVTRQGRCYRCDGTGRADYGSNSIPVTTDAWTPYRVDADGKYLGESDHAPSTYAMATGKPDKPYKHKPVAPTPSLAYAMSSETADALARAIPGVDGRVKHPVAPHDMTTVRKAIISLNDTHHWTRERIADWLDTLDVDLHFPTTI